MKKMGGVAAAIALVMAVFFVPMLSTKKEAWRPGTPLAKERMQIGVIYMADDMSKMNGYAYAHECGIKAVQEAIGLRDDQIFRRLGVSDADPDATAYAMRECIVKGANIIIATSEGYAAVCKKLAAEYPNVVFAQLYADARNGANLTNYFGRVYQAWYLSGIIAGLRTATNKIGYVAARGKNNNQITCGINAFALGVESVNRNAAILVKVTHRWFYQAGEFEAARSLIDGGCDVIAQYSGTPGPQLAARAAGVWGIGYNHDGDIMHNAEHLITSVARNWSVYYLRLVQSVIDGAFTTEPYFGGLKEGVIDLAPFNERLLPAGAAEAVGAARKNIESGTFDVFEGAMETNDGRIIGTEGHRLSDTEILRGMHWYYHNIVEAQ